MWHNFPALGTDQEYRLLLQPVPMPTISTGYNINWYFWPGPLARFPVVYMRNVIKKIKDMNLFFYLLGALLEKFA